MLLTRNSPNNSTDRIQIGPCTCTIRDRMPRSRIEGCKWGTGRFGICREAVLGGRPLFSSFRTSSGGFMRWQHRR